MLFLLLLLGITPIFIWAVMTQRIELRKRAATSEAVVCWNRVGGTAPNLYWPDGCKGSESSQACKQITVPLSATEVYKYNEWVAGGKPYIVGCGMTPPSTTSINWRTQYAYLLASDMVITANGKTFKGVTNGRMTVHSNPASATYTTLESTWFENGVEMRMFIYFDASSCTKSMPPQCNWRITELRIYNGNAQGDWIYFKGGDTVSVGARVGSEYTNPKLVLTSSENGIGKAEFTNLRLNAFTNQVAITPPVSSCTNQRNGASCTIGQCPTCPPGRMCAAIACKLQSGVCQNGTCVAGSPIELTCGGLQGLICPSGYTCRYPDGSTRPPFPDASGVCRSDNPYPTPTCIPRPACMDPLPGQPQCMPDLPQGGWVCPKTPTPSASCKTGVSSFSVQAGCPNDSGQFLTADYACYDGVKGTVGNKTTCQTSIALANLAQQACQGHSSCTTTPTFTQKPGDFNGDGKVNILDYNVVLNNFGKSGPVGFSPADLNADGKVNLLDYNMLLNYFGK